ARAVHGAGIDGAVQEGGVAERRGNGAVFQDFQHGAVGGPGDARPLLASREEGKHGRISSDVGGLRYNGEDNAAGAQTERRGVSRPVRVLRSGKTSPAAFFPLPVRVSRSCLVRSPTVCYTGGGLKYSPSEASAWPRPSRPSILTSSASKASAAGSR